MKYIVLAVGQNELPFLFPEVVQHKDIAAIFKHKVVSAGFIQHNERGKLETIGRSEGLKILSRPSDVELVNWELEPFEFVIKERGK